MDDPAQFNPNPTPSVTNASPEPTPPTPPPPVSTEFHSAGNSVIPSQETISNEPQLNEPNPSQPIGFSSASMNENLNPVIPSEIQPPIPPAQTPLPPTKNSGNIARKIFLVIIGIMGVIALSVIGYFAYSYFKDRINVNQPEPVTLTYWGLWESKENILPIIEDYQKEHPNVTINYEERSPEFYFETLQSRLATSTGPDIVRLHSSWVAPLATQLSPLPNTVMDQQTYEKTFYPVTKDTIKIGDSYYAIPLEYDGLSLIYNDGLFQQEGLKNPPETWEEFRDMAKKLTKYEEKDGQKQMVQAGAAIGFTENIDSVSDILGLLMAQNGVSFVDAKGNVVFDKTISPDGRNLGAEALEFYSLFSKGDDVVWNKDWISDQDAFVSGKLAMMFGPSWKVMNALDANKNLQVKVATVPQIPLGEDETTNINWGSFWVEGVSKNAKDQAVAWDFLKYISQREQMVKMFTIASQSRTFGEPYSRQDLYSTLSSDPYLAPYIKSAATATSWSMCDRTYDTVFNDEIVSIMEKAIESVNLDTSGEAAIKTAATEVQAILTEVNK